MVTSTVDIALYAKNFATDATVRQDLADDLAMIAENPSLLGEAYLNRWNATLEMSDYEKSKEQSKILLEVIVLAKVGQSLLKSGKNFVSSGKVNVPVTPKPTFTSEKLLDQHYESHVAEFGNITKVEYVSRAQSLAEAKASENILVKYRPDGDKLVYNKSTNEFVVVTQNNELRTYFKPTDGLEYFERQK